MIEGKDHKYRHIMSLKYRLYVVAAACLMVVCLVSSIVFIEIAFLIYGQQEATN